MKSIVSHGIVRSSRFLLIFSFSAILNAQENNSTIIDHLVLTSKILRSKVSFAVYLPPGFPEPEKQYPVLYLFHGFGSNHEPWITNGNIKEAADYCILNHLLPPSVLVMPDAGTSWNINDCRGKFRWEDMFIRELIPLIDDQYHTSKDPRYRALCGLSMGGYGAVVLTLKHPDMFRMALAMSAALRTNDDLLTMDALQWKNIIKPVFSCPSDPSNERITNYWNKNNPFLLIEKLPPDTLKQLCFFLDCGKDDYFYTTNRLFKSVLEKHQVCHEMTTFEGTHSWLFWRYALRRSLQYVGKVWTKNQPVQ